MAGAHGGSEYHNTKGVRMTDNSSCAKIMTFIANNSPNSSWTYHIIKYKLPSRDDEVNQQTFLECSCPFHSSGM